jgi:Fuc2NAc and GlcNAc transferase
VGAFCLLRALHAVDFNLFVALTGGGLAVAVVGFVDDRRPLSARTRLVVHIAAALWALVWLGKPPYLHIPGSATFSEIASYLTAVAGIVWVLNLYNFMDGIDGIAASEAVFVSWGGAFLLLLAGGSAGVPAMAIAFGAACCGFLLWNWPPAKIFMGDVGSGHIGYTIAVLALGAGRETPGSLAVWLILSGLFIVDASVTLFRRLVRGELIFAAHRSHAYQWLSRRWGSHKQVTLAALAVNLLWLLPWALFIDFHPDWAVVGAIGALVPLTVLITAAGAGRREQIAHR